MTQETQSWMQALDLPAITDIYFVLSEGPNVE